MFSLRRLIKSFRFALNGLFYAWRHEQSFRLQVLAAVLVLIAALWVRLSNVRFIVLSLLITLVLVLELMNTFFEKLVDLLSPRVHHYVAMLKDLLAATVTVAAIGAVIAGLLIFWPYFY